MRYALLAGLVLLAWVVAIWSVSHVERIPADDSDLDRPGYPEAPDPRDELFPRRSDRR